MNGNRFFAAVTLSLLALATPSPTEAAPTTPSTDSKAKAQALYLVGAKLHVGDGRVIENSFVHIAGDTIVAVGKRGDLPSLPETTKTIDLSGKLLTPGFIASDTLLGLQEIAAESSTRDDSSAIGHHIHADYDPSPAINADSSLIAVQAVEGITSAAVAPQGGLLSGQVTWIDLLEGDYRNIVAASGIAIDGRLGQSHADSRAASIAELRRVLEDARFYRKNQRAFDRGQSRSLAASPAALAALFPVLDGKIPLTLRAERASDILALVALSRDFDLRAVVIGGTEAWKVADVLAEAKIPVVLQPSSNLPGDYERMGARLDNAAILDRAGVPIVFSVLGDPQSPHNIRNISQEAGIAVAYGLPWERALQAITLNAASAYGMDARYGSIEQGKVANLVVWEADPFELSNWPAQVYIRGRLLPMQSRQTQLRDRYLKRSRSK